VVCHVLGKAVPRAIREWLESIFLVRVVLARDPTLENKVIRMAEILGVAIDGEMRDVDDVLKRQVSIREPILERNLPTFSRTYFSRISKPPASMTQGNPPSDGGYM
jgi:hypothetical protein